MPSQGAHARSRASVGSCDTRVPGAHVVSELHDAAFVVDENDVPATHDVHSRLLEAVGVLLTYVPAMQVVTVLHKVRPETSE